MKSFALTVGSIALLLVSAAASSALPAGAPAGTTALCNDGNFYTGAEKKGACRGHKGVKEWYGADAPKATDAKADAKSDAKADAKAPAKADAKAAAPAPAAAAPPQ